MSSSDRLLATFSASILRWINSYGIFWAVCWIKFSLYEAAPTGSSIITISAAACDGCSRRVRPSLSRYIAPVHLCDIWTPLARVRESSRTIWAENGAPLTAASPKRYSTSHPLKSNVWLLSNPAAANAILALALASPSLAASAACGSCCEDAAADFRSVCEAFGPLDDLGICAETHGMVVNSTSDQAIPD